MDFCAHNYVFVALYAYLPTQLWPQRKQYFKQAIPAQTQTTAPEDGSPHCHQLKLVRRLRGKMVKNRKRRAVHGLGVHIFNIHQVGLVGNLEYEARLGLR